MRLNELIQDSESQTKLKRILASLEKIRKNEMARYPAGQTPIEKGKNIGLTTGAELRSLGIDTLEKLKSRGWESVFEILVQNYPHRCNRNMLFALVGAVEDQSIRKLDPDLKGQARSFYASFGNFR